MNFAFKIFGAPYTFDLYKGASEKEIKYFQDFDSGTEQVKFVIRCKDNIVSYSYLRYNFKSSSGRGNSFFGMSAVFGDEYCADATKLYLLFDKVYKDVILKDKILIEEIKDNTEVQAKFLVGTFEEKDEYIRGIETIIYKNIKDKFIDNIFRLDSSFKFSDLQKNLDIVLNDDESINLGIVDELREYQRLDLVFYDPVDSEKLKELSGTIQYIEKKIETVKKGDITSLASLEKEIKDGMEIINSYPKNQPDLQALKRDFATLSEKLNKLKFGCPDDKIDKLKKTIKDVNTTISKIKVNDIKIHNDLEVLFKKTKGSWEVINTNYNTVPDLQTIIHYFDTLQQQLTVIPEIKAVRKKIQDDIETSNKTIGDSWEVINAYNTDPDIQAIIPDFVTLQPQLDVLANKHENMIKPLISQAPKTTTAQNKSTITLRKSSRKKKQKIRKDTPLSKPEEKTNRKTKVVICSICVAFAVMAILGKWKPWIPDLTGVQDGVKVTSGIEKERESIKDKKQTTNVAKTDEVSDSKKDTNKEVGEEVSPCLINKKKIETYLSDIENYEIKNGKRYESAIMCCDLVIKSECATDEQKKSAEELKKQAKKLLDNQKKK